MNFIKKFIPNNIKQEGKYFLQDLLKIPYSRHNVPVEILEWLPKTAPITFFDIGAHTGQFSQCICGEYKIHKGILVEPIAALIPALEEKFPDKNKFTIINAAISDSIAETNFYVNNELDAVSSLLKINNESNELASLNIKAGNATKVNTLTLDHITTEQNLTSIDLVKIDVQGAEHLVLSSASETLKKTKLVYTEFSFKPLYENSSVFFDLYNILYQNNFMLVKINPGYTSPTGELLQGDALFLNKNMVNERV